MPNDPSSAAVTVGSVIEVSTGLRWLLGTVVVLYVAAAYAMSYWAKGRIHNTADFIVAGRRLPLSLAWCTLLATWFGAGTLLAAASEAHEYGLSAVAADPFGAGVCLILAGLFFARGLWEMNLLTISDFFERKFGRAAEVLSACIMVPSYFGWIAAQFVALAGMLELFFGVPLPWGVLLVALVGMGYTLLGGMWSVTLTDAAQIVLVLVGIVVLAWSAFAHYGDGDPVQGLQQTLARTPDELLQPIDTASLRAFFNWLSLFLVGALGNIPGQDLTQRIFASKSSRVARQACILSGVVYLAFGMIPLALGLLARTHFGQTVAGSILPALAHEFLSPPLAVIFVLVLMSAVLSTIDSAILSPASVLSRNILGRVQPAWRDSVAANRWCVVAVTAASLGMAYLGKNAYTLLENAYELTLVGLFVPLALGMYLPVHSPWPAILSMCAGTAAWLALYLASLLGGHAATSAAAEPDASATPLLTRAAAAAEDGRLPLRTSDELPNGAPADGSAPIRGADHTLAERHPQRGDDAASSDHPQSDAPQPSDDRRQPDTQEEDAEFPSGLVCSLLALGVYLSSHGVAARRQRHTHRKG
jgi:Na+/proline symporter